LRMAQSAAALRRGAARRGAKESSKIRFGQLYPRWWERI
jgi:hypothetical protein